MQVDLALDEVYTERRDDRDKGYTWLATNSGVTRGLIIMAIKDHYMPKIETRRKMAEILRRSVEWLETGKEGDIEIDYKLAAEFAKTPHFPELCAQLKLMDAAEIKLSIEFMKKLTGEK